MGGLGGLIGDTGALVVAGGCVTKGATVVVTGGGTAVDVICGCVCIWWCIAVDTGALIVVGGCVTQGAVVVVTG